MRSQLHPGVERHRIVSHHYTDPGSGSQGAFSLPGPEGMTLLVVASDGRDWAETGMPFPAWEHVSVSLHRRCPTWREMEWVREQFWNDDETVMQLSVPRADHISLHPYCLHLWRPIGVEIPRPPALTIAPA